MDSEAHRKDSLTILALPFVAWMRNRVSAPRLQSVNSHAYLPLTLISVHPASLCWHGLLLICTGSHRSELFQYFEGRCAVDISMVRYCRAVYKLPETNSRCLALIRIGISITTFTNPYYSLKMKDS
jgi:hypothetical protein